MIVRQSVLRQAGRTITAPSRSWIRTLATESNGIAHPRVNVETPVIIPPVNEKQNVINPDYNQYHLRRYAILNNQKSTFKNLGVRLHPEYHPESLIANPYSPSRITLELLLASQSHLGHATSLWNPRNSRYIYGIRQGIHIISLDVTAAHLRRACRVVSGVAERAGLILFVGTRRGHNRIVIKAAKLARGCHLYQRWTAGSLTNGQQILGSCRTLVVDELDKEIPDLEDPVDETPSVKPDLVVCLNPLENWVMLHECGLNNIPTIGIIDTNADPTWITYPIPANDDSLRCVQLIAGTLGKAAQEGRMIRMERAQQRLDSEQSA